MVIELTGAAEETVLRMAEASGLTPAEIVAQELAHSGWPYDESERQLMQERIAEADRDDCEWVSHEEVRHRMGITAASK